MSVSRDKSIEYTHGNNTASYSYTTTGTGENEKINGTQGTIPCAVHISSTHISTVENGGSYSLNTLISICDGLNARLDYVLYGNIRDNDIDNLIDLLNLCSEKEILILEAVAKTLIENREK